MSVRVVLADPYALIRASLQALLDTHSEFEVIATTGDGDEAVRCARNHASDVVLLEALLSEPSGLDTVEQLTETDDAPPALVVSRSEQAWLAEEMLEAGASGYLLKRDAPDFLTKALYGVAQGQDGWISPHISRSLVPDGVPVARSVRQLTPRERDVLRLVAEGLQNPEIAEKLCIGTGTVKNHVHQILQKLGLPTRLKLIVWAHRHDLKRLLPPP
jgi:DNA-binding NarL/FixJ family response regulator